MLTEPLIQTIALYFTAIGLHGAVLLVLWRQRRLAPPLVTALLLGNALLGVRAFFPAGLAAQTGLYDFTDAVLTLAAACALAVAARTLARSGRAVIGESRRGVH